MKRQAFAATDIGLKRDLNEDCYAIDTDLALFAVCDGMGGHAAGEIASRKAIEFATEHIRENRSVVRKARTAPGGYYRVLELADDALQASSQKLYSLACNESEMAGMGTTLTMLLLLDDKAIMSHVGDSRLYLCRDKQIHQLSTDHTLAHELMQAGALTAEEASEESRTQHMLTRTIGQQELVQVESLLFDVFDGDTFLLCSDGLIKYLEDDQELSGYLVGESVKETPKALIDLAKQRGGNDNITVVVIRVDADQKRDAKDSTEMKSCLQLLRSSKLFRGMALSRLMRIMDIASVQTWRPGEDIVGNGQPLQGLYFVLEGKLAFHGDQTRSDMGRGGSFGEPALLYPHDSPVTITARDDSRTLFIPGVEFDRLARSQPKFGRRMLRRLAGLLSQQLVRVTENLVDMSEVDTWVERD